MSELEPSPEDDPLGAGGGFDRAAVFLDGGGGGGEGPLDLEGGGGGAGAVCLTGGGSGLANSKDSDFTGGEGG